MICENCKKEILEEDEYYEVIHYKEKEIINKRYVHRACQNQWENNIKESQLQTNKMAQDFIGMAKNFMKNMGAEEVVTI